MKAVYLLALLPIAIAAPSLDLNDKGSFRLERRADNYAQIKAALEQAASDVETFQTDLDAIPDNGPLTPNQEIKLQNDDSAILTQLQKASKACKSTSNFTPAESKTGYNDLTSLQSLTAEVLNDVVAHKAAFQSASLIPLVCSDLASLKNQTDVLGPCLASHSSKKYAAKAPALQAKFDSDFTNAMNSLGC